MVGKEFSSGGNSSRASQDAAAVAKAVWTGSRNVDGSFLWYSLAYNAPLSALAGTIYSANDTYSASPFVIGSDWIRLFVLQDSERNLSTITQRQYEDVFASSRQQHNSSIGSSDADLSRFGKAGGKLLTQHGLADWLIPLQITAEYFDRVAGSPPIQST